VLFSATEDVTTKQAWYKLKFSNFLEPRMALEWHWTRWSMISYWTKSK